MVRQPSQQQISQVSYGIGFSCALDFLGEEFSLRIIELISKRSIYLFIKGKSKCKNNSSSSVENSFVYVTCSNHYFVLPSYFDKSGYEIARFNRYTKIIKLFPEKDVIVVSRKKNTNVRASHMTLNRFFHFLCPQFSLDCCVGEYVHLSFTSKANS